MKPKDTSPRPGSGRERLKLLIQRKYDTRFHMSLILSATCLVAMISSWAMLHGGVHDMRIRYPIVVTLAYLTFLGGVWVWLRMAGFERSSGGSSSLLDGVDLPSGGSSGGGGGGSLGRIGGVGRGGGTFDGGGASASFAEGGAPSPAIAINPPMVAETGDVAADDGGGIAKAFSGAGDLGGDDLGVVILLLLLALAIFLASGYLVWMAPDILTEAAFGAALAGSLAKRSRQQSEVGWVAGVVRKTWWPFAIVLVLALAFAFYAKAHHPEARTFKEVLRTAVGR
jgi:hypothetical protein